MRYSTEPKYRKYIKGYSFLSFTEDLIGNKISDKITSKLLQKRWKTRNLHTTRKITANYWWLKMFWYHRKMEYQKITNKVPRFITKKWVEVHDQSDSAENRY